MQVQFQWQPYSTSNTQEVQYKLHDSNEWISHSTVSSTTNSVTIDNILPHIIYDFRINNICKSKIQNSDIETRAFMDCIQSTVNSTNNSVSIDFKVVGDIDKYEVVLFNNNNEQVDIITKTGPFAIDEIIIATFNNLNTATTYKYHINTYISKISYSKIDCTKQMIMTL